MELKRFFNSIILTILISSLSMLINISAINADSEVNNNQNDSEVVNPTDQNQSNEDVNKPEEKPDKKPSKPVQKIKYDKVKSNKKVNYYLKFKNSKVNYKIYRSGGYKTSKNNLNSISDSSKYRNQQVLITNEQKVKNRTWLKFRINKKTIGYVNKNAMSSNFKLLNVKSIPQRPELPTGCEIVAVTMMLDYAGAKHINKFKLAKEMPRSYDGNKGFVGSPYSKSGWWIYPKALTKLVKRHVGTSKNLTGASTAKLKKEVRNNHPVVVWVAFVDGFVNHAITMTGYDSQNVYYNDPWTNKKAKMSYSKFNYHRKYDKYRALGY
ncbi:hypothetical protein GSH19_03845 [Lactobacillus sp. S2-2]|uniref:C39 family peptidase n=1 Tax=Lactobacillus sp. S2-2 TaxID=2692917 RepID=UPI001F30EF1D|nr:C39 family peptidase [Lactobacillus sp. S2-2]MCF6515286.1 hypothetical protein [Lactobacillus sp. S2-2]